METTAEIITKLFRGLSKMNIELSIDDGYTLDVDFAYRLADIGIRATFYVPRYNSEGIATIGSSELREISALGHAIGAHTYNHVYLNRLDLETARYEIYQGKSYLEDVLGKDIDLFCLPGGKFPTHKEILHEFGFRRVRTTKNLIFYDDNSSFFQHTSFQFYPHRNLTVLKNLLDDITIDRLRGFITYQKFRTNKRLPSVKPNSISLKNNLNIHIWCHSWELERLSIVDEYFCLIKKLFK